MVDIPSDKCRWPFIQRCGKQMERRQPASTRAHQKERKPRRVATRSKWRLPVLVSARPSSEIRTSLLAAINRSARSVLHQAPAAPTTVARTRFATAGVAWRRPRPPVESATVRRTFAWKLRATGVCNLDSASRRFCTRRGALMRRRWYSFAASAEASTETAQRYRADALAVSMRIVAERDQVPVGQFDPSEAAKCWKRACI